jgi:hypothetical protein
MVEDHDSEGESVEDVEELILGEVIVSGQVQRGYEFVLQEFIILVGLVEA